MNKNKQKIDTIVSRKEKELEYNRKSATHIVLEMLSGYKYWSL